MSQIIDLAVHSPADERIGFEILRSDPHASEEDYKRLTEEIPNLDRFFTRIKSRYKYGNSFVFAMWFRIWCAIKAEEEIGLDTTLSLLRQLPDIDDRTVQFYPSEYDTRPYDHCFKILNELIRRG